MPESRATFEGIVNAANRIGRSIPPTPIARAEVLSQLFGAEIWIKNETVSPIASFKLRGALTALMRNQSAASVVTSSTGNHGQGVAFAARALGRKAEIFLPRGANPLKRRMIELAGARIHEVGYDLDGAKEEAIRYARDRGLLFVDDGESLDVIEGAGTVGLEIVDSLSGVDLVFVPMGSGSLASGVAVAVKERFPDARILAVQSSGAPAMARSFRARRAVSVPVDTVADGLVCREPARVALENLIAFVDDAIEVSDDAILAAMHQMIRDAHILVEPAGAASLAGAAAYSKHLKGERVVLIASGANVTDDILRRALDAPFAL
ncbi:MAG TPA: pyridoxal-phosphate dependent enzyme [Thermoanaerobaculia bacterium]